MPAGATRYDQQTVAGRPSRGCGAVTSTVSSATRYVDPSHTGGSLIRQAISKSKVSASPGWREMLAEKCDRPASPTARIAGPFGVSSVESSTSGGEAGHDRSRPSAVCSCEVAKGTPSMLTLCRQRSPCQVKTTPVRPADRATGGRDRGAAGSDAGGSRLAGGEVMMAGLSIRQPRPPRADRLETGSWNRVVRLAGQSSSGWC